MTVPTPEQLRKKSKEYDKATAGADKARDERDAMIVAMRSAEAPVPWAAITEATGLARSYVAAIWKRHKDGQS